MIIDLGCAACHERRRHGSRVRPNPLLGTADVLLVPCGQHSFAAFGDLKNGGFAHVTVKKEVETKDTADGTVEKTIEKLVITYEAKQQAPVEAAPAETA